MFKTSFKNRPMGQEYPPPVQRVSHNNGESPCSIGNNWRSLPINHVTTNKREIYKEWSTQKEKELEKKEKKKRVSSHL